jgi:hypothetical protein
MAKRITERQRLAVKLDSLSDTEVHELLEHLHIIEAMRRASALSSQWDDSVVAELAQAKENRRAQQVFEWEAARQRADRRATQAPYTPRT